MCFEDKWNYEQAAAQPPRPVAQIRNADRYEKPRRAPLAPPNQQVRKRAEGQVKMALRNAERVESNRQDRRFATSNKDADKIRESTLEKAKQNRARAPPAAREAIDDDSGSCHSHRSALPSPLNIRKKAPQPQRNQQRAAKPADLGNTIPARRATARPVDESHVHPALRKSARPVDQSQVHPALRTTTATTSIQSHIHPALRNLPAAPARPTRPSDPSQSSLEREFDSYLGGPGSHANSPQVCEVSPLNINKKLPDAPSHKRR